MIQFRKFRHTLFALLAVLCLLGMQQGAWAHGLSHVGGDDSTAPQKHLPHAKACEKCAVYAEVGSGAPPNACPALVLPPADDAQPAFSRFIIPLLGARAYTARAPPFSA